MDMTGIEGDFEIRLDAHIDPAPMQKDSEPREDAGMPSIFNAVKTLGLRLETSHANIEHLVVDRADRVPTEN